MAMNNKISTLRMSYEDWLEARRVGLGGSDVAAILGLSKWGTPFSVWQDKVGISKPDRDNEAMYWGRKLEDLVAERFQEVTGLKTRRQNAIFVHYECPWMIANVDRVIVGENKGLEIKTTSEYMRDQWQGDSIPDIYYCQVQHYIEVMGWNSCWAAVLIGGNKFVHKEVPRDPEFIRLLIEKEREFWETYVIPGTPPPLTCEDNPSEIYPENTLDLLEPTQEAEMLAEMLYTARQNRKMAESEEKGLENKLLALIGEHEGIRGIATWKNSKGSVSWKAVAEELGAPEDVVEKYRSEGKRRFSFAPYEKKKKEVA